ncbi:MAG TPA: hypothetical protein VH475_22905 [Tepidisphaeraceae bacterium]
MQYYLVLDPEIPDVYFESSAFPKASDQLEAIATRLGLPSHFELFSYAAQNDLCPPEAQETEIPWHDPQVGIDWLEAVSAHIRSDPASVPDADRLLKDFSQCIDVLRRAKTEGSKWHFAMDI